MSKQTNNCSQSGEIRALWPRYQDADQESLEPQWQRNQGAKAPRLNSWDPLEQQGFQGESEPARRRIKIKHDLPGADNHTQKNSSHNA